MTGPKEVRQLQTWARLDLVQGAVSPGSPPPPPGGARSIATRVLALSSSAAWQKYHSAVQKDSAGCHLGASDRNCRSERSVAKLPGCRYERVKSGFSKMLLEQRAYHGIAHLQLQQYWHTGDHKMSGVLRRIAYAPKTRGFYLSAALLMV